MSTQTVYDIAKAFQLRLLKQEHRAASQMVRVYHVAWKRIKAQLLALQEEYDFYTSQEFDIPGNWYYRSMRARALEKQIAAELEKFSTWSERLISEEQKRVIEQTLKHTEELIRLSLPPEFSVTFNRINKRAVVAIVGLNQSNSALFRLFQRLSAEGAAKARDALIQGVLLGYSPRKIAPMLRDALGISLTRALNIARTETIRAQRIAALENYRANDNIVKGWIWSAAIGDIRTCPACIAMHGTVHPLDEEMQSHVNCRCAPVPESYTWEELYERWGIEGGATLERGDQTPDQDSRLYNREAMFERLTDEQQRHILGNTRWLAWKDGLLSIDDFVKKTYDPEWGAGIAVPSLKDALGEEVKKQYQELARWHVKNGWDQKP